MSENQPEAQFTHVDTGTAFPQQASPVAETGGFKAPGGGLRPSIRDRIAAVAPYTSRMVTVAEWDNVIVEIRSLSLGERNAMLAKAAEGEDGGNTDISTIYPEMVMRCTFDPETGEKVFNSDEDEAFINSRPANLVDKLAMPAMELSGMKDSEKAVDDAAKKSSETEPASE